MINKNTLVYFLLFGLALVVNLYSINADFFTDDPALYASIAKNMVYRHEFLSLFSYGQDWLDKPHFPFWMAFLSFKLFGISTWAYRLPALLFFCGSIVYTFLFTKKFYGIETAYLAALILMTAQHILMSNTDVRAEPYLMALIIGSIYHIARLNERFTLADLLMAAVLTACAIMTKGVFVIVAIYGALAGQLIFQKKFKQLFTLKWIALFLLTVLFILPELYALYTQFDLHPEKVVFGKQHVSGIKWFLWDSQFGRFANNGPITRKSGDVFFFVHTLLWALAPWCLLFYFALYKNVKAIIQKQLLPEYYCISGGLLLLILFSLSQFQLPFYTNILFPLFAVITAPFVTKELSRIGHQIRLVSQWLYIIVFPLAIILITIFLKPGGLWFAIDCVIFSNIIFLISTRIDKMRLKTFFLACATALYVNFYLSTVMYPAMAAYNGEIAAANYLNQNPAIANNIYVFNAGNNIFQFYCKKPASIVPIEKFAKFNPVGTNAFYADEQTMTTLRNSHAALKVIKSFQNYPKETFTANFISKENRHKALDTVYLVSNKILEK